MIFSLCKQYAEKLYSMRLMYLAFFYLLLTGCMVIPISLSPLLPKKNIDAIHVNVTNKQEVSKLLGSPDVKRDSDNIWIYSKGKQVAEAGLLMSTVSIPIMKYKWLFLQFNKKGYVIEKELINDENGCTKSGYCLYSGWYAIKRPKWNSRDVWKLINERVILLMPQQKQRLPELKQGNCRYFLYDIGHASRTRISWWLIPYSKWWKFISININDQGPYTIDYSDTFSYVDLPAGKVTFSYVNIPTYKMRRLPAEKLEDYVQINDESDNSISECIAGQTKYLRMSLILKPGKHKLDKSDPERLKIDINLFEVDPIEAKEVLKKRKLIVQP